MCYNKRVFRPAAAKSIQYRESIMRKKCLILSAASLTLALAIYAFTYYLYHYLGPDGFGTVFYEEPTKPLVTLYFGIWGVMHQFAAFTALLVGLIFGGKKDK